MLPIKEIARAQGIDEEDALEIVKSFVEYTSETDLPALDASLKSGHFSVARQRAHSIKGAALNLNLKEVAAYAAQIERECVASDPEGTQDLLEALTKRLNEIHVWLEESKWGDS
jgi:HPt (histidine-containing phosphotransfer) domain-containing protein